MATPKRPIDRGLEKFWDERFRDAANEHFAWQLSAGELGRAIDILHKEVKNNWRQFKKGKPPHFFTPSRVCMMLCGQMLEALFKAVLVSQRGAFNNKGKFAHKGHDLIVLADQVGLRLSDDEAWLLEKLTHYVEWAGRYPIPLSIEGLLPRALSTGGSGSIGSIRMEKRGDIEAAKQLAKRLRRMLPHQIRLPRSTQDAARGRSNRKA